MIYACHTSISVLFPRFMLVILLCKKHAFIFSFGLFLLIFVSCLPYFRHTLIQFRISWSAYHSLIKIHRF